MSLQTVSWPLKDLGNLIKAGDNSLPSLVLAVTLPVCAAGAAAIVAADGLKAPTLLARIMVGGSLGAAVAGTATTGLTGNRHPPLALLALALGATLGMLGASALRSLGAEPSDRKRTDAADPAVEAAREHRRRERAAALRASDDASAPASAPLATAPPVAPAEPVEGAR